MAWTEKYIRSDALNGTGNENTAANSWTLAYALDGARTYGAPMHFYVIADGTHTLTTDISAKDGYYNQPNWFEGRDSSGDAITPARTGIGTGVYDNGPLDTTDYPDISMSSEVRWTIGDYSILDRLDISVNEASGCNAGSNAIVLANCSVTNSYTGARWMIYLGNEGRAINCDFEDAANSGVLYATGGPGNLLYGNRIKINSTNSASKVFTSNLRVACVNNLFIGNSTGTITAIDHDWWYGGVIKNNTFYLIDTCIEAPNKAQNGPYCILDNLVWDCDKFLTNPYGASAAQTVITANNAIDTGCTAYDTAGYFNRINAKDDTTLSASPFVDAANDDFNLANSHALIGASLMPYMDVGALQRSE